MYLNICTNIFPKSLPLMACLNSSISLAPRLPEAFTHSAAARLFNIWQNTVRKKQWNYWKIPQCPKLKLRTLADFTTCHIWRKVLENEFPLSARAHNLGGRGRTRHIRKQKRTAVRWTAVLFGLRRRDLNHTTFGLWADKRFPSCWPKPWQDKGLKPQTVELTDGLKKTSFIFSTLTEHQNRGFE